MKLDRAIIKILIEINDGSVEKHPLNKVNFYGVDSEKLHEKCSKEYKIKRTDEIIKYLLESKHIDKIDLDNTEKGNFKRTLHLTPQGAVLLMQNRSLKKVDRAFLISIASIIIALLSFSYTIYNNVDKNKNNYHPHNYEFGH